MTNKLKITALVTLISSFLATAQAARIVADYANKEVVAGQNVYSIPSVIIDGYQQTLLATPGNAAIFCSLQKQAAVNFTIDQNPVRYDFESLITNLEVKNMFVVIPAGLPRMVFSTISCSSVK